MHYSITCATSKRSGLYCTRTETGAHIPAITSSRAESRAAASVQAPPGPLAALRDLLLRLLQTIPGDYMQQSWSTLSPTWQYEVDEDLQDVSRAVECFTTFLSQVDQIRWPNARQYGRRCHNLTSAEALLDVVAGCLDDLRRLPGIQEAAPSTQLSEAESHGCSGVGSRDGTPQRGTGRSSNIALEPEYGRSHGRSLSLPQVGEEVTACALPATQAGREVIDLCSSGDEENDSQVIPPLAEEVAGAHTPAAAGLRTPTPPDDPEDDSGGSDSVYVECHHGFIVVEGRQGDPGVTPICRRRGCIRRALKLWRRHGDRIRQADHEAGGAHEPIAGEDGVWRVASTTGLHEVFGVHADGCRYSVHIFKASARTHDLDAGFALVP